MKRSTKRQLGKYDQNIIDIVNGLRNYWPLTLRQIYYQLVAAQLIDNRDSEYKKCSRRLKQLRLAGSILWKAMEDRTRRITDKRGFEDADEYIKDEIDYFLSQYDRCYVQGQEVYLEVWLEKDALSRLFENICWQHCIRLVVNKGYQSTTFTEQYARRARLALEQGQKPVILYFGDFDPSGIDIFESAQRTLNHDFGIWETKYERIALNLDQIHAWNLPHDPEAVKKTDRRYRAFIKRYGHVAVELDAIHPEKLQSLIKTSIQDQFDMELFDQQKEVESVERAKIYKLRHEVLEFIDERIKNI